MVNGNSGRYDDARAERDFRMNPPKDAPGQGADGWDIDMSGTETNSSAFTGSNGDIDVNNLLNSNENAVQGSQQSQLSPQEVAKQYTAAEDKFFDTVKIILNGLFAFFKEMYKSCTNNKQSDWHLLGERMFCISMGAVAVGLFLAILSPFIPAIDQPGWLMIGGLLSGILGVILMMYNAKESPSKYDSRVAEEPAVQSTSVMPEDEVFDLTEDMVDDNEEPFEFAEDDFDWDVVEDNLFDSVDDTEAAGGEDFNVDDAIEKVTSSAKEGIYTRQYLYETMCSVLPKITPNFARMQQVSENSDEFMEMSEILRSAAYQVGTKDENIPDLTEMRKNIFIIQLRATRPAGLKEQDIADAVADAYSRDEDDRVVREGVYATVDSTVGLLIINIFVGNESMISLRDVYGEISDFVLDTDVKMPFVWGVNELGTPLYCDLKDCDSIIISGEPRSGKSWKGQSIVAQLSMYNSPKELQFYVFDPKDASSDYRVASECLPHAKYFCGDPKKINAGIKKLIEVTEKETGRILADNNCKNIKDYNRKHPQDKLPYKYIIIDEMMSLMNDFDKDEQAEFKALLSTIVSRLAYLGVRVVMFPHRIVDNVISKNTYSLVSSRAVVRQLNYEELKNAMGVSRREFPYNLNNMGDMALKTKEIAKGRVVFCHAEVLTKTNEGNDDLFKFIGSVWRKLEPDCQCIKVNGSVGGRIAPILGGGVSPVQSKEAIDHTAGKESYHYGGYSATNSMMDLDSGDSSLDESEDDFWSSFFDEEDK